MSEVEVTGSRRRRAPVPNLAAFTADAVTEPIRWVDRALIAHYRIFEYTRDPDCLLRVALTASPCRVTLSDGTSIACGETVAELHLWSQRTMTIFREGVSIRAGLELRRRMTSSFAKFGVFLLSDARFASVHAILVRTSACEQFPRASIESFARTWGFEVDDRPRSAGERSAISGTTSTSRSSPSHTRAVPCTATCDAGWSACESGSPARAFSRSTCRRPPAARTRRPGPVAEGIIRAPGTRPPSKNRDH